MPATSSPSRQIALLHEFSRYRGKVDVAFVALHGLAREPPWSVSRRRSGSDDFKNYMVSSNINAGLPFKQEPGLMIFDLFYNQF